MRDVVILFLHLMSLSPGLHGREVFIPSLPSRCDQRRKSLDRALFWTTSDLEEKLLDFQHYYNDHRTHTGRNGYPPVEGVNAQSQLLSMADALSRLMPNEHGRVILVIRHPQVDLSAR